MSYREFFNVWMMIAWLAVRTGQPWWFWVPCAISAFFNGALALLGWLIKLSEK